MSSGPMGRARAPSIHSARSSKGRAERMEPAKDFAVEKSPTLCHMEPCAATASMFLYAQGSSIVCCHHDTLAIERRFTRHAEDVQLLAVDNRSERGAGRLVVSYDAGQTAIVWDLLTGDEIARFASYDHLTCATWMHNGNVAFGTSQGYVILFEPPTSEHISARTIDQIAVTALAPGADNRTFAIGYQNGSLLIANLRPRFTILSHLSTSRGPSPLINLAWHGSSRRGSDMLSAQTYDGDLRVWSVPTSSSSSQPKVARVLRRTENFLPGPNWMAWSKNGRIIQFSEGETVSWDVRTTHVTSDPIPTPEVVRGLAVYGPAATLFTLGPNNTVQQFDLNAPAVMVVNVQHPANLLPPSPPISLEEQEKGAAASNSESESISIHMNTDISTGDDEDHMSPLARLLRGNSESQSDQDQYRDPSEISSRSSISMSSGGSRHRGHRYPASNVSRGMTENTYISTGSSMYSSGAPNRDRRAVRDSFSTASSLSKTSSQSRSRHSRPSRLRNEVARSPETTVIEDLFQFTRSRLNGAPYRPPYVPEGGRLTNDDLRRQMLSTIFGWNREVEDLIRDEMSYHPAGSSSKILLARWLGNMDSNAMMAGSNMTAQDWMFLALTGMGGASQEIGQTYIKKLLHSGDIHTAATIMISLGDYNDAIEIYDSHKRYMEALLLVCLFFPSVWERQKGILRKWERWAAQHGQHQLASKCTACMGKESSEPWISPSAAQLTFQSLNASIPEMLSPPLSPPDLIRGPQRSFAKGDSLKLVTNFNSLNTPSKFYGADGGQTPIAATATPIADSAMSPGNLGDPATAVLHASQRSAFNTPASARPVQGFDRQRLPSIGEAPGDTHHQQLEALSAARKQAKSTHGAKGSHSKQASIDDTVSPGIAVSRASTASPGMMRDRRRVRDAPPPSPSPESLAALMEGPKRRNGSRTRIPGGLDLHLPPVDKSSEDITSPEQTGTTSSRHRWPSRRRGPGSIASSVTTASSVNRSHRGHHAGGRSLDDYIHSLDAAQNNPSRGSSRGRKRESSRSRKQPSREGSRDRGRASSRNTYTPKGPKRSPTSPIPMSPEDLINLTTPKTDSSGEEGRGPLVDISQEGIVLQPSTVRKAIDRAPREPSRPRVPSRAASRDGQHRSPERRILALDTRGRSRAREGSSRRSPSPPLPASANVAHFSGSEDEDDLRQALEAKERFRRRNGRSNSRGVRDATSPGPAPERGRERSESRQRRAAEPKKHTGLPPAAALAPTQPTAEKVGDLKAVKDDKQQRKEAAARELEERRKSLARRPSAPTIPHPHELSPVSGGNQLQSLAELSSAVFVPPRDLPTRSQTVEPGATRGSHTNRGPPIGLPATPKAMRLVQDSDHHKMPNVPVPPVPATFYQASPSSSPSHRHSPTKTSPRKTDGQDEAQSQGPTALLPSTVYSPPTRQPLLRSMSCPPEEPVAPQNLRKGFDTHAHSRGPSTRKASTDLTSPRSDQNRQVQRRSQEEQLPPPPPPPPAPPIIRELQHLATPPPPPPAPLPHMAGGRPVVYGGQTPGNIEVVMDDDSQQPQQAAPPPPPPVPVAIPVSETTVPIIAPPAPPSSRNGHRRGRSSVDNSIAGRISRATERMRSASRSRTNTPALGRTKSPETSAPAPYESIPLPNNFPSRDQRQPEYRTGLHQSEMI